MSDTSRPSGVLITNRAEIAIRISRTCADIGERSVAVYSADDAESLHVFRADVAYLLPGSGPAAYLDSEQLVAAAVATGCGFVHPGYGFLSESPELAACCAESGLGFVGPSSQTLDIFGNKSSARDLAVSLGIPVLAASSAAVTLDQARTFFEQAGHQGGVMIKAAHGGGGRGMRAVHELRELEEAYALCRDEAQHAFGNGELFVEQLLGRARHVEVQIVGDGSGAVTHLWERDCSVQRRNQKLIEIAPSPRLDPGLRRTLLDAAMALGSAVQYRGVGTVEFLLADGVDASTHDFYFLEVNPRLQVEHTVTEEITGVDIVAVQLAIAAGANLADLGMQGEPAAPNGFAIQARVNAETLNDKGEPIASAGRIRSLSLPGGRGVRIDSHAYVGYTINPRFDSLLAKVVVHDNASNFGAAARRAARALREFDVQGVVTNVDVLHNLITHPDFAAGAMTTTFVDAHLDQVLAAPADRLETPRVETGADPASGPVSEAIADGLSAVRSPMVGVLVALPVQPGAAVRRGATIAVLEAMKMQHPVLAEQSGVVTALLGAVGDQFADGQAIVLIEVTDSAHDMEELVEQVDLDRIRPDLADSIERHAALRDEARREVIDKRTARGARTARQNVAAVCDPDTFVEIGGLVIGAQRTRRSVEELMQRTPADGLVAGIGSVNTEYFGAERSRTVVMAYDYTVLAGTQGLNNHAKKDRMFDLARRGSLPVVIFAEGGGGRPGDTDVLTASGLNLPTFRLLGQLSGQVPLVGVVSGRCFAGNAALVGCCDVVIATRNASIGMGGPAMIEGGGLGIVGPDDVGPVSVQAPNGVIDVVVEDEQEAAEVARKYLSYFQGDLPSGAAPDPRVLRGVVPEDRLRAYDVRLAMEGLLDVGTILELRREFGVGIVTALGRIGGRPIGVVANSSRHLGGAIDADGADKAARFLQLCDAFGIPILTLCDTPGFMVGAESERTATVRHFGRLFVHGANLAVPLYCIVLRKCYGLGAIAMMGGSMKAPDAIVAWPTGEFGGMGLEGAVRLGFKAELAAASDDQARAELFDSMVADLYAQGKATNTASFFEIDDVIDPASSREWLLAAMAGAGQRPAARRVVDPW